MFNYENGWVFPQMQNYAMLTLMYIAQSSAIKHRYFYCAIAGNNLTCSYVTPAWVFPQMQKFSPSK